MNEVPDEESCKKILTLIRSDLKRIVCEMISINKRIFRFYEYMIKNTVSEKLLQFASKHLFVSRETENC